MTFEMSPEFRYFSNVEVDIKSNNDRVKIDLSNNIIQPQTQISSEASYCYKIKKNDILSCPCLE